jgi:two-component system sensor histidine kinase CpxA
LLHKTFENVIRTGVHYTNTNTNTNTTVRVSLSASKSASDTDTDTDTDTENFTVRVEDEGPGVPEEDLSKLFDSFYRVDAARQRDTGGYGLGLSIARRAVVQHGGVIIAENTSGGLAIMESLPQQK